MAGQRDTSTRFGKPVVTVVNVLTRTMNRDLFVVKVAGLEAGFLKHVDLHSICARCLVPEAGFFPHVQNLLQDRAPSFSGIENFPTCAPLVMLQIGAENNGRCGQTDLLKESPGSFCRGTGTNAVCHARVRARGFRLVKVGRGTPKAPSLVALGIILERGTAKLLTGFAVCNPPERLKIQSPIQETAIQF